MLKRIITLLFIIVSSFYSCLGQNRIEKHQLLGYQNLNEKYGNRIKVNWSKTNGSPDIISFNEPVSFGNDQEKSVANFIKELQPLLNFRQKTDEMIMMDYDEKKGVKYYSFHQRYKDIPVKGGEYVVTVLSDGRIQTTLGSFYKDISIETRPNLTLREASLA